jgi:hypothetical protein
MLLERAGRGCAKTHIADEAAVERDEEQVKLTSFHCSGVPGRPN